jgi:moderate conductance mechanosensitive channel
MTNWLGKVDIPTAGMALGVAAAVAWLAAYVAARSVRAIFLAVHGEAHDVAFSAKVVRTPIRVVWLLVFLLVVATLAVPALQFAGADIQGGVGLTTVTDWALRSGLRIGVIMLLAYAAIRITSALVHTLELQVARQTGSGQLELTKRANTLGSLIRNVIGALVVGISALMVLQELDIDIMPLLTGAGIAGLAVGFGAQTLVRDVISGFFLILEDQVRVGDVAEIDGTGGLVERIGLRTIVLRDLSGTVHIFPNGGIQRLSNLTKDFSYYLIDMGVAYKEDTDAVVAVMQEVADELKADPAYGPSILKALEVLGVDSFDDSQVTIKVRIMTIPLQQWAVGREYRRRLKKAFDARGIEIPFPHLSVYFGEASKPFRIEELSRAAAEARPKTPGT